MLALDNVETIQGSTAPQVQPVNPKPKIGILIVAYNAVTTLVSVLERIPPQVWDGVTEVAIFDDASRDATHILATGYKLTSGNTKITVRKQAKNLGYGGNQKSGYNY